MATPKPLLRLKRTAAVALDELAVALPPSKRSKVDGTSDGAGSATPRTLRFRRVPSPTANFNVTSSVKNRRVIDIDLAGLLDSPGPSPSPVVKATPEKSDGVNSAGNIADEKSVITPDKALETPKQNQVFDLYEQFDGSPQASTKGDRVGWLNSSTLPADFFGDLLSDDEEDDDYQEGDERSVDYPSTPSSSDGDDDDEISAGEIDHLHTENPDWAKMFGTRSRFQDRKFDGASDSDDQ